MSHRPVHLLVEDIWEIVQKELPGLKARVAEIRRELTSRNA